MGLTLSGDMPVSAMQKLQEHLESNGVKIENFKVDANKGQVLLETNVDFDETDVKRFLKDKNTMEKTIREIEKVMGKNVLNKITTWIKDAEYMDALPQVVFSAGIGGFSGALFGAFTGKFAWDVAVVIAVVSGVYLYLVRDKEIA